MAWLLSGCISVRGGQFSKADLTPASRPITGVSYSLKWQTRGTPNSLGSDLKVVAPIEEGLNTSGLFTKVNTTKGSQPYHLDITVNNHGDIAVATLTGVLSGLTLTILPGYARDNYTMTAKLMKGEQVMKTYEVNGRVTSWTQLLLVFAMPFNSRKEAVPSLLRDMTRALVSKIARDQVVVAERSSG